MTDPGSPEALNLQVASEYLANIYTELLGRHQQTTGESATNIPGYLEVSGSPEALIRQLADTLIQHTFDQGDIEKMPGHDIFRQQVAEQDPARLYGRLTRMARIGHLLDMHPMSIMEILATDDDGHADQLIRIVLGEAAPGQTRPTEM